MAGVAPAPGRPVWLELNAQRVTDAIRLYETLFAWTCRPLHVPPWGSIPLIASGERVFANQFMAMGAFATPRWMVWFSGDLDRAAERTAALGGDAGEGVHRLGDHSEQVNGRDPAGNPFGVIHLLSAGVPEADLPGEPCMAEFWGPNARDLAPFYAEVLDLRAEETATGATLFDGDSPRLFLRETEFEILPPRWIPYFRTSSVGGDVERACRAGAVVQVHAETVDGIGEMAVLSDPANACFGLVNPATT